MDSDSDEEIIVFADFEHNLIKQNIFESSETDFRIIGLDTDNPLAQLNKSAYKGVWTDCIGTKLFFEEDPSPDHVDPVFTLPPPVTLKYLCKTRKVLKLSRVVLQPEESAKLASGSKEEYAISAMETEDGSRSESVDVNKLVQGTVAPTTKFEKDITEIIHVALTSTDT